MLTCLTILKDRCPQLKLQNGLYSVTTEQTYGGKHTEVIDMQSPHKYLASVTDL